MVTFRIPDMTCGHCASTIAKAIAGVDKAARVDVRVADKLVSVTSSAADADVAEAIRDAGYTAQEFQAPPTPASQASASCCGCGSRTAATE